MWRVKSGAGSSLKAPLALGLLVVDRVTNVGCCTLVALSGRAQRWRTFILLQFLGRFFGLFTQPSFTVMVRYPSLPIANAAGIGTAFVFVAPLLIAALQ